MNSGRMKVYLSSGLALVLLVQVVLFFLINDKFRLGVSIILSIMVALALLNVYFNYQSVRKSEEKVKSLSDEYRNFYLNADEAVKSSSMKKWDKKNTMDMILEILLHAYEDGRRLEDLIGSDSSAYINNFIQASGGRFTPLYMFGLSTTSFFLYLLLIKAYKVVRQGEVSLKSISIETLDVGIVVIYFIIAFMFMPWLLLVLQKASLEQWSGFKKLLIFLPLSIPILLILVLIIVDNQSLRVVLDTPLPIMGNIWLILICIFLALAGIGMVKYSRKLELRKLLKD